MCVCVYICIYIPIQVYIYACSILHRYHHISMHPHMYITGDNNLKTSEAFFHSAILDFSQALELDKVNHGALRNRGIVYLKLALYPQVTTHSLSFSLSFALAISLHPHPFLMSDNQTHTHTHTRARIHTPKHKHTPIHFHD